MVSLTVESSLTSEQTASLISTVAAGVFIVCAAQAGSSLCNYMLAKSIPWLCA